MRRTLWHPLSPYAPQSQEMPGFGCCPGGLARSAGDDFFKGLSCVKPAADFHPYGHEQSVNHWRGDAFKRVSGAYSKLTKELHMKLIKTLTAAIMAHGHFRRIRHGRCPW
jgi:hypothetical protein